MVKFIDGDFILDQDYLNQEDIIVTGTIKSKKDRPYKLGTDGTIKATMIFSVDVSAYYIQAYGLHVPTIYASGVDAMEVYTGYANIRGHISADVLDADIISASLIRANKIRANDISADFVICGERIKKSPNVKTSAKLFVADIGKLERKDWD